MKFNINVNLKIIFASVILMAYSCDKNNRTDNELTQNEITIFEDAIDKTGYKIDNLMFGRNIKKVTVIDYDNTILKTLKSSTEWKEILSGIKIDYKKINRTYVYNSNLSLITIPIINNKNDYFNIYIHNDKYLITKLSESGEIGGLITYKIQTPKNDLYYQFDLNSNRQIGNWLFKKGLPKFLNEEESNISQIARLPANCNSLSWNDCMNCLILDVCGSDWVCTVACGVVLPSCIGAAALVCVIV